MERIAEENGLTVKGDIFLKSEKNLQLRYQRPNHLGLLIHLGFNFFVIRAQSFYT